MAMVSGDKQGSPLTKAKLFAKAKRGALIALTALSVAGGAALTPAVAEARTVVTGSPDGRVIFVCVYDDKDGHLLYCDVYINYPIRSGLR